MKVYNTKTGKVFVIKFDTEFERDKYIRRSRYFKNLKGEKLLNKEIQKLCKKQGPNNETSKLLTDRYLTLQLLNEVKLEEYDKYRKSVKEDLDTINKITTPEELKSFKKITLSQANKVNKKYKKYKSIFKKIEDGEYDAIQIIPFSAVNFAFNMYYIKKHI